jgi:hypothetical protein
MEGEEEEEEDEKEEEEAQLWHSEHTEVRHGTDLSSRSDASRAMVGRSNV